MSRRRILILTLTIAAAVTLPSLTLAQSKIAPRGITIAMPITTIGASHEASIKGMQAVAAVVRKQPGLIVDLLMENKNPDNQPSHMHVMHWREQKNWEALFSNPDFQKVVKANAAVLTVAEGADIYMPLE